MTSSGAGGECAELGAHGVDTREAGDDRAVGVDPQDGGRTPHLVLRREVEVLGHVETEAEAIEVIAALTQLYREQGRYLERIYKWAKRVGITLEEAADRLDAARTLVARVLDELGACA